MELITMEELTELLKISRSTVDRWRREGLPYTKIGRGIRFEKEKVMAWIKDNKAE